MVIGQDIANQRKELEEMYKNICEELHKKLELEFQEQKRQAKEKYQKQLSAFKLQYTDEIAEEIAKVDKQCEECWRISSNCRIKETARIPGNRRRWEIQQRKVLENSEWELPDYQNNLKGKYRVKTA